MKREVTGLAFTRSTYLSETYEPRRLSLFGGNKSSLHNKNVRILLSACHEIMTELDLLVLIIKKKPASVIKWLSCSSVVNGVGRRL